MSPKNKNKNLHPIWESLVGSLERVKTVIEKRVKELNVSELETRAQMVDSIFSQLNNVQAEIEQEGEQLDLCKRQVYEELYCDVKSRIISAISSLRRRSYTAPESNHDSTLFTSNSSTVFARIANLPKIKIPSFTGKYTDWTNWYNSFVALIDNDNDLDNLSKFIHLRSALDSIPLRTIEALELSAENYPKALKLLKERYENKTIIVQAHMKELFEIQKIQKQNASSLRDLIDTVNAHLRALDSLATKEEVANVAMYYLLRSKIDSESLKKWEDKFECSELPSWETLSSFLINRCAILENRELNSPSSSSSAHNDKGKKGNPVSLAANQEKARCPTCNGNHEIIKCSKFLKLASKQRYYEAKRFALCILCLMTDHSGKECKGSRCSKCDGKHHVLLHWDKKTSDKTTAKSNSSSNATEAGGVPASESVAPNAPGKSSLSNSLYNSLLTSSTVKFLATALLLVKDSAGKWVECRAILDSGSQLNFISEELARSLRLKIKGVHASISGIGSASTESVGSIKAVIRSKVTNFSEALSFLLLPNITQYSPNVPVDINKWNLPKNVKLADPKFNESRVINMLLGVSTFFKLLSVGQISLGKNMPTLQKSLLGWILAGEYNYPSNQPIQNLVNSAVEKDNRLSQLVERFWSCEDIAQSNCGLTPEEKNCEDQFVANMHRTLSGRFVVRLPFKPNHPGVGESFSIALRRFESLERKLERNLELKSEYVKFIEEYRSLDHLEIVAPSDLDDVKYIMPHHAVIRPDSLSTKLRVVFDASCKSENGYSLNDNLLVGPRLQPELFDILIRFRLVRYAITADISKMYRQVLMNSDDCYWQCILWRDDKSKRVDVLRLKTVTYGTSAAPYLAVRCLQYLAEKYESKFPVGSKVITNHFYMDDMLVGANTIEELLSLKREVTELLELGKFELHKWRASGDACKEMSGADLGLDPLQIPTQGCAKTLGVLWTSAYDTFGFTYSDKNNRGITKRIVLSEIASLFDPLGLINPVIVLGKIFMQEIWMLKLDWDEALPQSMHDQWQKYREQMPYVANLTFPRYVADIVSAKSIELHGFSDASNRAYGCVIYMRTVDSDGNVSVNILTAKSRVAPLNVVSLPRLELQGAVMLARLCDRVKRCSYLNFTSIYLWTDSSIVLDWLSAHPSRWKTFVANRVALIHSLFKPSEWNKIDSKSNPADIVSRGMLPIELEKSILWFKGPEFLRSSVASWPAPYRRGGSASNNLEERPNHCVLLGSSRHNEDLIATSKLVNSYSKLQRTFAFMSRWLGNARLKLSKNSSLKSGPLSTSELQKGLLYIIFNIQQASFYEEYKALCNNLSLKSSRIQALCPFIDNSEGISIIRVGGRLSKADFSFATKHPVLLPANHIFTRSLAEHLHKLHLHAGAQTLLAALRQRFWVVNGRKLTQGVVRKCIPCFKRHPKPLEQRMGDFPRDRLVGNTCPFQKAGVDFAGPIMIHYKLRGKRPTKAYLALFICFLTKACHIEVVSDLSTPAFLCALKRFFARRGLSSDIYCDNATNFVGAARELKRLAEQSWEQQFQTDVTNECAARGVNFHFIPPHSPHMGGLWESAIKVAKSMLIHHINGASLTFEELTTVTAEIEGIMNSRPVYSMSSDPNDLEALTPGHFLIGRPLNSFPEPYVANELMVPPANRWKRVQHIKQIFWRRWAKEYLLSLQQRAKWKRCYTNIKVGALVMLVDDNLAPGKWQLGRVETVIPGQDGLVRVVTIRTSSGIVKRNIHKICPLPEEKEAAN